jgi:hypothetical protein
MKLLPRRPLALSLAVCAVSALAAIAAATARADTAALPSSLSAPWSDPNHQSPVEQLAGQIASQIAGYPVAVHCDDAATWAASGQPGDAVGLTLWGGWWSTTYTFAINGIRIELSPPICESLQAFAQAAVKPTKCQPPPTTIVTTTTHMQTGWVRKVVKGKWVHVKVRKQVKSTTTKTVPSGEPQPCFADPTTFASGAMSPTYEATAKALETLAHESIHMRQDTAGARVPSDGLKEAQAECSGMQWTAFVALQFGDTADDAQSIANYYWSVYYPRMASLSDPYAIRYPYWSAECRPGGALDERPAGSTLWP